MSADLWAAFGSPSEIVAKRALDDGNRTHTAVPSQNEQKTDEDDKWETDSWSAVNAELETAWSEPQPQIPVASHVKLDGSLLVSGATFVQPDEDDFGDFEEPESESRIQVSLPEDATTAPGEDGDDFGDFAEAETVTAHQEPLSHGDRGKVEALQDPSKIRPNITASRVASQPVRKSAKAPATTTQGNSINFNDLLAAAERPMQKSHGTAKKNDRQVPVLMAGSDSENSEENWDDLTLPHDPRKGILTNKITEKKTGGKAPTRKLSPERPSTTIEKQSSTRNMPPPTNVPPPSILMSLMGTIILGLPEKIRVSIVETWDEDEADVSVHIRSLEVIARIVAGRKLRWKRDTILAQSMRIGMSGRQGGMKLAGVDRAESQREDREASELVRVWRQHVGAIRSALAEAKSGGSSGGSKPIPLPVISESALVRTAKTEEGGITAAKCCVLCGLRRDERVDKVDAAVWDQFSEWWTEHWGHKACKAFWETYKPELQQR